MREQAPAAGAPAQPVQAPAAAEVPVAALDRDSDAQGEEDLDFLCIPTFQPADHDLVGWTDEAAYEKDRLLESFFVWAGAVCREITAVNDQSGRARFWADYVDPCSGYPALSERGGTTYSEVDGMQMLLRYTLTQVGQCSVLRHPEWGTNVYPASVFTNAPVKVAAAAIEAANSRLAQAPVVAAAQQPRQEEPQ